MPIILPVRAWHIACTVTAYGSLTPCALRPCALDRLHIGRSRFLTACLDRLQIGPNMLTPGQIAINLDVSPATVRRWSTRFARHLTPHTPGKTRTYTVEDLAVLTRVRDLSVSGTPLANIDQALAVIDTSAESKALVNVADFAKSLQTARDQIAHLQNQLDTQTARLDALTAWIALPFYKRIGKKAPLPQSN